MDSKHEEIFDGKTFSGLLQDIYKNSEHKKLQINVLINELRPLITDVAQAAVVVPLIADYLDVAVKNDDELVKMANVFQKFMAAEKKIAEMAQTDTSLTDEERKQLLGEVNSEMAEMRKSSSSISNDIKNLIEESDKIKESKIDSEVTKKDGQ